jgi:hypothetical protein
MPTDRPKKLRWYHPSPGRLLFLLLPLDAILFASDWIQLSPKGWTVVLALASVAAAMLALLFWFLLALFRGSRFQFSIRSLMLSAVVVALPFSWLAVEMNRARKQAAAAVALNRLGAKILSYQNSDGPSGTVMMVARARAPAWLREVFSDDFFAGMEYIDLRNNVNISDADLAHSSHYPRIFQEFSGN